jgi:hypothetical protein
MTNPDDIDEMMIVGFVFCFRRSIEMLYLRRSAS